MQVLNIAGYQFIPLTQLEILQENFLRQCNLLSLKGTILLSEEGININLAGAKENIHAFKSDLIKDNRFTKIRFHETYSTIQPFQRLKIKIKKEIITLGQPDVKLDHRAPSLEPELLRQWLDEKRNITLLDTRNDYEIRFGTFKDAVNLNLANFGEFPSATQQIERDKPIVMFCTGGIRCEKAAIYLANQGFHDVYQLEGGILNYFAKVGGKHYQGECFVFDERISVDTNLEDTKTLQCSLCQGPVTETPQPCTLHNLCFD